MTYKTKTPHTVVVLYGGTSSEREVSLVSGKGVGEALEQSGHEVVMIDTGERGFMHKIAHSGADVVFIALHGAGGEDGTIQGALELLGLPYTGSGVLGSALAMDKYRSKMLYEQAGLNTAKSLLVSAGSDGGSEGAEGEVLAGIGAPCVIKPTCEGSSVGVTIVHEAAELAAALENGFSVSKTLLAEAFVSGTEITVAVLGNDDPMALPVIEIIPKGEFYDFESKYAAGGSEHVIPARISPEATAAAQAAALQAHQVLGCCGMSRTDMIVDANDVPWVIETNTIPGMTPTSLLPDAARAIGIGYPELCDKLLGLALAGRGGFACTI